MSYERSYEGDSKPFNHDKNRGKWSSSMDFVFTCVGHSFKFDSSYAIPVIIFKFVGVLGLIPYIVILLASTIPIIVIQSFLGQFSSTGFISVFRISPIFKGIGYASLVLNITTLTFYSLFAALPLFFFVHSLRPTLPWSCEGMNEWGDYSGKLNVCNKSHLIELDNPFVSDRVQTPSLDFLAHHLNATGWENRRLENFTYSWSIILCCSFVWFVVWVVVTKSTERIGRIIRYSTVAVLVMLGICFLRFMFLPGAFGGLTQFIDFYSLGHRKKHYGYLILAPLLAMSGLGPGWGSVLTMASYNKFKTNTVKYSWIVCLGQFALMTLLSFSWVFIERFLTDRGGKLYFDSDRFQMTQFLIVPTALSFLEMPNFWSLLYLGMLTLGATNLVIVQLFSVLTSLFDEYEELRRFKKEATAIAVGVLALGSLYFCSSYGIFAIELFANYATLTQIFLNLMLLLVVLWIYGRERFQRDFHFMTSRIYNTWMVNIVRFIAPIFLIESFAVGAMLSYFVIHSTFGLFIIVSIIFLLPWLLVPGYCFFKLLQASGMWKMRFRSCSQPKNWYPADIDDRQRYMETFENPEVLHQLTTNIEDNV